MICCWNSSSCAISLRSCTEQAHGGHVSARVSDCSGVLVALVGKLAARSDHCPARHHFALAPSRLLGNLGIRLMSPLARRRQDQGRGLRAYSPNEPRELLWGAPRIHGELLKLGFVVSQATVSRYIPRSGYPPTQRWRTFLRNQAFAIGAIGFGEAGRLPDVVRGWIMRVAGAPPRCGMASLAGLSSHR